MERIAMSQEERDWLDWLKRARDGKMSQAEAAEKMGVSDRWVRKLVGRMKKQGDAVVVHGLRGRASNRRIAGSVQSQALEMLRQPDWHDFGPTFATEQLAQALGKHEEMRRIVEEMDSPVVDYLKAQLLIVEKRHEEALAALERMTGPGLFLQTADLYLRLRRLHDAQQVYEKALAIDPDNAHAHIGLCRIALRTRKFSLAARSALDALERIYQYPLAHFLLGRALAGMKEYTRAADAFRAAISFNPNFPEAHVRLAALLEEHLGDADSAREHRRLARRMRNGKAAIAETGEGAAIVFAPPDLPVAEMPPLSECLVVVTGLPRSGTSMLMQMLAAGGLAVLSDGRREADDNNPRGYLEFEPVKNLLKNSPWLSEERGKAIKIVAPLLATLPPGLACRVILCERDLEEVLDSQERMLVGRTTPERRRMLKAEYARILGRVKAMLARRPGTQLLVIEHRTAISDSLVTAEKVNQFLGGDLDAAKMAAAVEPALHRNRVR